MHANKRSLFPFAVLSVGYIVLGLFQLLFPENAKTITCYILGIIAIVCGILRIAFYFIRENAESNVLRSELAIGVVLIAAGVYLIARPLSVAALLSVLLGFCIVFDSVIKMQTSFELRRTRFEHWWIVMIAGAATAVLGGLLIVEVFGGNILPYFIGVVLILDGLLNIAAIVVLLWHHHRLDKQAKQTPATLPPELPSELPPEVDGSDAL